MLNPHKSRRTLCQGKGGWQDRGKLLSVETQHYTREDDKQTCFACTAEPVLQSVGTFANGHKLWMAYCLKCWGERFDNQNREGIQLSGQPKELS